MNARIKCEISRTRAATFFISKSGWRGLNITKALYVLFLTHGGILLLKSKELVGLIVLMLKGVTKRIFKDTDNFLKSVGDDHKRRQNLD
jgi:hypothetical protein